MLMLEIVLVAMAAIRANLLRSFLTTLGIVIGVAAVIAMVALGEGAQRQVNEQIEQMGTNVLTIRPGQSFFGGVSREGGVRLTVEDAEALKANSEVAMMVAPDISSRSQVTYLRYNANTEVMGTWPEYFDIYNHSLLVGRFFHEGEVQGRRRVAVLGYNVPEDLETPAYMLIGETIQIGGQPFEVIGVMEEKGSASRWFRPDDQIYIPVSTAQYRVFGGRDRLSGIAVAAPSPDELDPVYGEIDRILRREHRIRPGEEPDFSITNASDLVATFNETTRIFTVLLAGIAGVSLLVGGIGIMNIMLVSVTERTREIGVRKALGATRKAILFQFLVEALTLCVLGGILGVLAGMGSAALMRDLAQWNATVSPAAAAVALGFSAAIGLFFGIWPAQRAAKLDPIDALRYE